MGAQQRAALHQPPPGLRVSLRQSVYKAYLPGTGSPTNGKVWPTWLNVPEVYNFATSSASASDAFRSRETCTGYTGKGEEYPTGTLGEQITRYLHDVLDNTDDTLDYTHIVAIGGNEPGQLLSALARYTAGGAGYVDPVAFENIFEITDGVPTLTFTPMIRETVAAWREGIDRLMERGVTGRILLANLPSPRGFPSTDADTGIVDTLDQVFALLRLEAQSIVAANPQVRMLDFYTLSAAIVDDPDIFTQLGFTGGPGSSLTDPCLVLDFVVDSQAEIMGNQGDRAAGCQEECALCADTSFPCQTCFEGNPSAVVCDTPDTYIFWDTIHLTGKFHQIVAESVRECSEDNPDYGRAWVEVLCP